MITEAIPQSDTFVPLVPRNGSTKKASSSGLQVNVVSQAETKSVFEALSGSAPKAHATEACAKPTVTLQKNGDIVSSIRIQCGCGQVIELNCLY